MVVFDTGKMQWMKGFLIFLKYFLPHFILPRMRFDFVDLIHISNLKQRPKISHNPNLLLIVKSVASTTTDINVPAGKYQSVKTEMTSPNG